MLRSWREHIIDEKFSNDFLSDGQAVDVSVTQIGPPDDPELKIEAACAGFLSILKSALATILEKMLGTGQNLSEFYVLASGDAQLAQLAARFCGLKPPRFPTLFEELVNGIACQQITLTLGILLLNKLASNYGMSVQKVQKESTTAYAFPRPEDLAGLEPQDIRRLGLSNNKARAIIELARMMTDKRLIPEDLEALDDETVLARLCQLRGVGRWTAEYVMLLSRWEPYSGFLYFHLLLDAFISLLQAHSVAMVVDVRTIPRSRHNPQFNHDTLPDNLHTAGISYAHMPGLGGLRHARKESPNTGWHNSSSIIFLVI